jgi:hypothetical protein
VREPEVAGWDRTQVQVARIGLLSLLLERAKAGEASGADFEAARRLLVDLEQALQGGSGSGETSEDPLAELRRRILERVGQG